LKSTSASHSVILKTARGTDEKVIDGAETIPEEIESALDAIADSGHPG
jgi:hypothetical protein